MTDRQTKPFILLIGGTSRPMSTTEKALRHAIAHLEHLGARTRLFDGNFLSALPHYDPENPVRTAAEKDFIAAIRECDGILVGTPGYHGSLSGPIKNALDWIEDTAKDERPYLTDRAFGCIITAYGWQACGTTLVSLRLIAHALRAWPTPMGATLNATTALFDANNDCIDDQAGMQIKLVAEQVFKFSLMQSKISDAGHPALR